MGDGGVGGGGVGGGGVGGGGVGGGVGGGGVGGGVGGVGGGGGYVPDGGYPNCLARPPATFNCTADCPAGFRCVSGLCRLNGGASYLQVTLRWDTYEDLDLHVIEPRDAGFCEVYWGERNTPTSPSTCGARGSLDLDSEAACVGDGVDIENVIYPQTGGLVPGTYRVMVNHYKNCNLQLQQAGYQLEVRKGSQTLGLCGMFRRTDADWGNNANRTVMTFTIP